MQQYIRIDEAVKKYSKTRQTFYNYINKGILEVKKINNRLFLDSHAIENLMKTVIDNDNDLLDEDSISEKEHTIDSGILHDQLDTIEELLQTNLVTRLESLQQNIQQNIGLIKQEILYDLKNILGVQMNHIISNQNTQLLKFDHLEDKMRSMYSFLGNFQILEKKIYFYGGILLFTMINYILSILI